MGNNNHRMSPHQEGTTDAKESVPNGYAVHEVQSSVQTADQPYFVLHGIDYLPEFEKRKERRRCRKSTVPRFLRIDTTLWSNSYLRFLNRINRSALPPGAERQDSDATNGHDGDHSDNGNDDEPMQPMAVETPDCFKEIVSDEWVKYGSYPFENLVLSGGGSKGYAYIGSLQVSTLFYVFVKSMVYAPCERTGRNGKVHVTFSAHVHGT